VSFSRESTGLENILFAGDFSPDLASSFHGMGIGFHALTARPAMISLNNVRRRRRLNGLMGWNGRPAARRRMGLVHRNLNLCKEN
jgi:hypothetical protein